MSNIIEQFAAEKIVAILRNVPAIHLPKVVETLLENNIRNIEITLNSPGALEQISDMNKRFGNRVVMGAGTVTRREHVIQAVEAGASYLITPYISDSVAEQARIMNVPVMMGAMTPTEIARCMELGAAWVKVFPISSLSKGYIQDVLAPMPDARLVAVGGITPDNVGDYLRSGAVGVGVGSALVKVSELSEPDWERRLAQRAQDYVHAIETFRKSREKLD